MKISMYSTLIKYRDCTAGVSGMTYGIIAALASVGIIGGVTALGGETSNTFGYVAKVLGLGPTGEMLGDEGQFEREDAGRVLLDAGSWLRTDQLEGWDLEGVGYAEIKEPGYGGVTPNGESKRAVDMGGSPGRLTMARDLDTVAGQDYTVSFELADIRGLGEVEVWAGGVKLDTVRGGRTEYVEHSISFTATSNADRLEFREVGSGVTNVGSYIANVEVR